MNMLVTVENICRSLTKENDELRRKLDVAVKAMENHTEDVEYWEAEYGIVTLSSMDDIREALALIKEIKK